MSAFWAPCKAPKYSFSVSFLITRVYFGRLARRPRALEKFAKDKSGKLSWNEFQECLGDEKMRAYLASQGLDPTDGDVLYR